jgi:integrase/recombinase XerD
LPELGGGTERGDEGGDQDAGISPRGVRAMLARYATAAGLDHNMPPHRLRHFLFTWLKTQGIDDALIQPYSGHTQRQSLEIYSRLSLADAQPVYDDAIRSFPV